MKTWKKWKERDASNSHLLQCVIEPGPAHPSRKEEMLQWETAMRLSYYHVQSNSLFWANGHVKPPEHALSLRQQPGFWL